MLPVGATGVSVDFMSKQARDKLGLTWKSYEAFRRAVAAHSVARLYSYITYGYTCARRCKHSKTAALLEPCIIDFPFLTKSSLGGIQSKPHRAASRHDGYRLAKVSNIFNRISKPGGTERPSPVLITKSASKKVKYSCLSA